MGNEKDEYGLIVQSPKDKTAFAFYQFGRSFMQLLNEEEKLRTDMKYKMRALLEIQGIFENSKWEQSSSAAKYIVRDSSWNPQ